MFFIGAKAQTIRPLDIGDTLPIVAFGETLLNNAPAKTINDLKGKLVILDFYATTCSSCVKAFPSLDSLQQAFKNEIQIVIVNYETKSKVEQVFKKRNNQFPQAPMMVSDTLLNKLFPHQGIPHHVWIDQHGVIRYITFGPNATANNVQRFLHGEDLRLSRKKELLDFNRTVNLYSEGGGRWIKDIQYHTLYTKGLYGVYNVVGVIDADPMINKQTIRFVNVPLKKLFQVAYNECGGDGTYDTDNRIDFRAKNVFGFLAEEWTDSLIDRWNQQCHASYEAVLPGTDNKLLYEVMRRDLNIYSPFIGHIEKQKVKCLVLVNNGIKPIKGSIDDSTYTSSEKDGLITKNYSIANSILPYLQGYNVYIKTPIIDVTGYTKGVDINLKQQPTHLDDPAKLASIQRELQSNGLDLKEEYRVIDMLVIEDRK